ncbi:TRAP transporter small permease [Mesorhizobium marinum]|uniref:TRAP transporter small permease n=1 Tax=Mesorhizobium marinum TaxID=3228790 RepID=UPI003465C523
MTAMILKVIDRAVLRFVAFAASLALAVAATLAFVQVILRFVLSSPVSWTDATTQLLIVWMVHLGVAVTMRAGALVSVDAVRRLAGVRAQPVFDLICAGITLVFLGNLVWFGIEMVERAASQNHPALGISMSWGYAAVPVGAAFAIVAVIARILDPATEPATAAAAADAEGART